MKKIRFVTVAMFLAFGLQLQAQQIYGPGDIPSPVFAIKTNLLYDSMSSINLGIEIGLSKKTSLDLSGSYNPWEFGDNRKMKHWMAQPEFRLWTCKRFVGHFFALHALGGEFNVGGMVPWGFRTGKFLGRYAPEKILKYRYEGWYAGGGIGYGYHWIISNHFSIEAEIAAGAIYIDYDKYPCEKCAKKIDEGNKVYLGPTKAAVSLIYTIK